MTNQCYNLEIAKFQADLILDYTKELKDDYMKHYENRIDTTVEEIMNEVLFDLLSDSFKKDIEMHKTS